MKKTNKLNKILSICCLPTFLSPLFASSCSSSPEASDVIITQDHILSKKHKFQIFGETKNVVGPFLSVRIINSSSLLIGLEQEKVSIKDDSFVLNFIIDAEAKKNDYFKLDLSCNFQDLSGESQTKILKNFEIYYLGDEDEHDDRVSIENRNVECTDSHIFNFVFYFSAAPKSNINVTLENETTGLLSLPYDEYIIDKRESVISITVPVILNIGISETQSINFNFNLKFKNSHGENQETKFVNCIISYIDGNTNYIPEEYFDIYETQPDVGENIRYVLRGLKEGVSPVKLQSYTELRIPDNVDEILPNAFKNNSFFDFGNIEKISIPKSVDTIGEDAFLGLTSLYYIDISTYTSEPIWLIYNSHPTHKIRLFDEAKMLWKTGYVWIDKSVQTSDYFISKLNVLGLPANWSAFGKTDIFPYENYDIGEDSTTLLGIKEEALDDLENYKIIEIPENITTISNEAFKELSTHPYINKIASDPSEQKETRRLILNNNLLNISQSAFLNAGISGPIFFNTQNLWSIGDSAFENCTNYDDSVGDDFKKESTSLMLHACYNLKNFRDFCFNLVPLAADVFNIPQQTEYIGSYAFFGSKFKQIIFTKSITSIGEFAFADTYSWPQSPSIELIDLSAYNEIIDPDADEPTYIPQWFYQPDHAFEGNVTSKGKICVSIKIKEEIEDDEEADLEEWEKIFKAHHGIPNDWEIEYK